MFRWVLEYIFGANGMVLCARPVYSLEEMEHIRAVRRMRG